MGCENSPIVEDSSKSENSEDRNIHNNEVLNIYPYRDNNEKLHLKKTNLLKYINISQDDPFKINQKLENEEENNKNKNINGINIVHNLETYFSNNITEEKIKEMIFNVMSKVIVDNKSEFIPGKNITKKQAEKIAKVLYKKITKNKNSDMNILKEDENINSILKNLKVKIEISELDKESAQKIIKKDINIDKNNEDINKTIQEISKDNQNIKILFIKLEQ